VLWHCWLGSRKGIRPVKNWAVGCWHGYLSGARCRLAKAVKRMCVCVYYIYCSCFFDVWSCCDTTSPLSLLLQLITLMYTDLLIYWHCWHSIRSRACVMVWCPSICLSNTAARRSSADVSSVMFTATIEHWTWTCIVLNFREWQPETVLWFYSSWNPSRAWVVSNWQWQERFVDVYCSLCHCFIRLLFVAWSWFD